MPIYVPPKEIPKDVPGIIEYYAMEYGVPKELPLKIAKAESNYIPEAKNKESTASGIFQFLDGTFQGFCIEKYKLTESLENKNDPKIQAECAVRMLAEGGEEHWKASEFIWRNM